MSRITITVINDLVTDQRMHRTSETLHNLGYTVLLIGRILPESNPVQRNYKTSRLKLLFKKGPWFYAEYNFRLFFYLLFKKVDVLLAVDLDTLPANFLVSKIRRKPLIYDAHELFTEMPELVDRPKVKRAWESIERLFLPKLSYAYTVCGSIANLYNQKYGLTMKVVRNVPFKKNISNNRTLNFLPPGDFVIYQGAVNKGRGLELLIDSFSFIENYYCVIAGTGDIINELKERAVKCKVTEKVIFTGRLPLEELHHLTCKASFGVSIEEHLGMNYFYALPNKLFDYIQARVPVLVSDLPEMRAVVEQFDIGTVVNSRTPELFARQLVSMFQSDKRSSWKENLEIAAQQLNWEQEQNVLIEIVKSATNTK